MASKEKIAYLGKFFVAVELAVVSQACERNDKEYKRQGCFVDFVRFLARGSPGDLVGCDRGNPVHGPLLRSLEFPDPSVDINLTFASKLSHI